MAFKSQAQLRKFASMVEEGKISKEKFQEWLDETTDTDKLPERITKKKSMGKSPRTKEKIRSIKSKSTKDKRVYMSGSRTKVKRQR
jgi:polyhydroxyalkanoate synthesis regulator phasin